MVPRAVLCLHELVRTVILFPSATHKSGSATANRLNATEHVRFWLSFQHRALNVVLSESLSSKQVLVEHRLAETKPVLVAVRGTFILLTDVTTALA